MSDIFDALYSVYGLFPNSVEIKVRGRGEIVHLNDKKFEATRNNNHHGRREWVSVIHFSSLVNIN